MTRTVGVMTAPDPDLCTHDHWDTYLESVDLTVLTWAEVEEHRARVEQYTARIVRESAASRAEVVRLLDARDAADADAEALSRRCAALYAQILDAGAAVLAARRDHPQDEVLVRRAQQREEELSVALAQAQAELATANLRAIQAALDAR